jgi:hypothetical protein
MGREFYASASWDFQVVQPLVIEYLEAHQDEGRYPFVISDTQLYDDIQGRQVAKFGANRLFHCISRVLRGLGYERRSRRGRTWDRVGDSEIPVCISPSASHFLPAFFGAVLKSYQDTLTLLLPLIKLK